MSLQQDMEPSMQCPICCDFYRNPVLLVGCHHSFCSECIHRNFKSVAKAKTTIKTKLQCPVCRFAVSQPVDKYLVPNRTLEEIVQQYCQVVKPKLERGRVAAAAAAAAAAVAATQPQPQPQPQQCQNSHNTTTPSSQPQSSPSPSSSSIGSRRSPRTKRAAATTLPPPPTSTTSTSTTTLPSSNEQLHVNYNVNRVPLKAQDALSSSPPIPVEQPPPPRRRPKKRTTYYNKLKFQDLKKLCVAEQLPTHGSETMVRTRHEEWVLCYNAECDSSHPVSVEQLRREFIQREHAKTREQVRSNSHLRSSDTELVSTMFRNRQAGKKARSGNSEFDTQFHTNFQHLIQQVRQRQQKGKMTPPLPLQRPSTTTATTTATLPTTNSTSTSISAKYSNPHHNHNIMSSSPPLTARTALLPSGTTVTSTNNDPSMATIGIPPPTLPLQPTNTMVSSSSVATNITTATTAAATTTTPKTKTPPSTSSSSSCQNNHPNTVNRPSSAGKKRSHTTTPKNAYSTTHHHKKLKWTCPLCTYSNTSIAQSRTRARCLMCQTARPLSPITTTTTTNDRSLQPPPHSPNNTTTTENNNNPQVLLNIDI